MNIPQLGSEFLSLFEEESILLLLLFFCRMKRMGDTAIFNFTILLMQSITWTYSPPGYISVCVLFTFVSFIFKKIHIFYLALNSPLLCYKLTFYLFFLNFGVTHFSSLQLRTSPSWEQRSKRKTNTLRPWPTLWSNFLIELWRGCVRVKPPDSLWRKNKVQIFCVTK